MSNSFKKASALLVGVPLLVVVVLASAYATVPLVEFYHAGSDHYFTSADPLEIDALDRGVFAGWTRTGYSWPVIPSTDHTLAGTTPVCRFYGLPSAGLDSHFYSASPDECTNVEAKFADQWEFESGNVFQVYPSDLITGACPTGTQPVYRTWNNRRDSNHRYTTDAAVQAAMVAKGYIAEGYGNPPVAMCAPTAATTSGPQSPPSCSASASNPSPTAGASVTLTADCSGSPTAYAWTDCTGSGPTCIASSSTPGAATYNVTATNAYGFGSASTSVSWQPPVVAFTCTASASTTTPAAGTSVQISTNCNGSVATYRWTNYSGTDANPNVTSSTPGPVTYTLTATSTSGKTANASVMVNWQPAGGEIPTCVLSVSSSTPAVNSYISVFAVCTSPPPYEYSGCGGGIHGSGSCHAVSSTPGRVTYKVRATSSAGTGPWASAVVTWQP